MNLQDLKSLLGLIESGKVLVTYYKTSGMENKSELDAWIFQKENYKKLHEIIVKAGESAYNKLAEFYIQYKEEGWYESTLKKFSKRDFCVYLITRDSQNPIGEYRAMMGHKDPDKAAEGTIRKLFAKDIGDNALHGSDSVESVWREIKVFFPELYEALMELKESQKQSANVA